MFFQYRGGGGGEGGGGGGGMSVVMFAHCPVRTDNRMCNGRGLYMHANVMALYSGRGLYQCP